MDDMQKIIQAEVDLAKANTLRKIRDEIVKKYNVERSEYIKMFSQDPAAIPSAMIDGFDRFFYSVMDVFQ